MMKETEIKDNYTAIVSNTVSKNLRRAFDLLSEMLVQLRKPEWIDKKEALEQNYQYLLQYAIDGIDDPEQENIYNKIRTSLLVLADQAYNALMTSISNEYPYIHKRSISKIALPDNTEIEAILSGEECDNKDQTLSLVFSRIWLKAFYSDREITLIDSLIYGDETKYEDKCMLVSAIMLGLLLQFDEKKFEILTTISSSLTGEIQNRAFIALLLCCDRYYNRLQLYPNIQKKIQLLATKNWFNEKFATSVLLFVNGLETEKISKEMKDSIMPDLMKETSILSDNLDIDSMLNNLNGFSENPEWDKIMDKYDVSDKIQRFVDLQRNGADVFLGTFSSMKSHAFFSQICNWFRPYNTSNSWVIKEFKGKSYQLFDFISLNPSICDSDRYSMLFSLSSVPESYLKSLEENLKIQADQIKLLKEENSLNENNGNDRMNIQLYWQNLYRFFRLHPNKSSFPDPYETGINIVNLPFINAVDNRTLMSIVDSLMKKKFYSQALSILLHLVNSNKTDAGTLQKLGFCYQKKAMYAEALSHYEKAEIVSSNNVWLDKVKAYCYMQTQEYEKALDIYKKLSLSNPDDLAIVLNLANSHIALKQYAEAIPALFKLEYLSPSDKIYRLIAWCAFVTQKYEQATTYINKIELSKRSSRDWTILGHISWCQSHKGQAIDYYQQAYKLSNDKQTLIEQIQNDISYLEANGIKKTEVPFVLDRIRYIE